ncbi:dynamin family protein [Enterocloster asparagiformis]|uniref:dynamin family protein n=1 Tax=Enterocloster asparagiformis TaxID=333367 RepID=UPI002A822763|nr:dynamin family protein [Enterocloster asparagiformis]
MKIDYKQYELTIYELSLKLSRLLEETGRQDARLGEIRDVIVSHHFSAAVVGEFKKGKSSLINALLGQKVLPSDTRPTTATLNRITYGSAPGAMVEYKDGTSREIPVDDLAEYVTKLTESAREQAAKIRQVVVEYPTALCQNDVDVIDTPGLQDDDAMTDITVQAIRDMDLAIFTISALFPVSQTEQDFLVRLLEDGTLTKLVVAVTFVDLLDEEDREEILPHIRQRLQEGVLEVLRKKYPEGHGIYKIYDRMMGGLEVFPCSSKLYFKALKKDDMGLVKESGIPQLKEGLIQMVMSNRRNNTVVKCAALIQGVVDTFCGQEPGELSEFREKLSGSDEKRRRAALEQCLRDLAELHRRMCEGLEAYTVNRKENLAEEISRRFIRELSGVQELSHWAVRRALFVEIKNSFQYVRDSVTAQYKRAVEELVRESANLLARSGTTSWDGRETAGFWGDVAYPDFRWYASPLPEASDYTDCEVMDSVRRGVRESVQVYLSQADGCVRKIREACLAFQAAAGSREETAMAARRQELQRQWERASEDWKQKKLEARTAALEAEETLEAFYRQLGME